VLILGAGNPFRQDDAAGLQVARRLRARVPAGVTVIEAEGDLVSAIETWREEEEVVLIDAMSSGVRPGTVLRFEAHDRPVPASFSNSSTHSFGLAEAVELARALGNLPPRVIIYGIEGKDFAAGEGISNEVEHAVGEVVERVLQDIAGHA
jgi:hydrogenase maturation protease